MPIPQSWTSCDGTTKNYIKQFVELLKAHMGESLLGVYLHGSLAMGSYYPPKSDIDILAVARDKIPSQLLEKLGVAIAHYSDKRPTTGDIEFSLLTKDAALAVPSQIPYELHYSAMWHDRILNREVVYGLDQYDTDLSAHLLTVKQRGVCLYGLPINEAFGDVRWDDFRDAVMDDLNWILSDDNILESPFYGILNICRVLQLLGEKPHLVYSKDEGGQWAITHLPAGYVPLVKTALDVYHSDKPVSQEEQKTGGMSWDKNALLKFRDWAKAVIFRHEHITTMTIRPLALSDAEAIRAIYAPYISDTCVSFETVVPTTEAFKARVAAILKDYPFLVAEADGRIVGYAYASKHRERAAYRFSADVSVYIAPGYHRQGIGKSLYVRLFELLKEQGIYTVCAGITVPNEGSVGLHESLGFTRVGTFHNTGYKFGKWLDVLWLEKPLRDYDTPMPEGNPDE